MAKADFKTNVMRVLEGKHIPYTPHTYDVSGGIPDGKTAAKAIGKSADEVYKTLVTRGAGGKNYVFVIPVASELDLKKAAKAVGEKSIEMIRQAELLPLTGYIHGGCSPIGMKKQFPTVFEEEIILLDTVTVSAGKVGYQIELSPQALLDLVDGFSAPLVKD